MRTVYIGNDKCSRCHGTDPNCVVCHEIDDEPEPTDDEDFVTESDRRQAALEDKLDAEREAYKERQIEAALKKDQFNS